MLIRGDPGFGKGGLDRLPIIMGQWLGGAFTEILLTRASAPRASQST